MKYLKQPFNYAFSTLALLLAFTSGLSVAATAVSAETTKIDQAKTAALHSVDEIHNLVKNHVKQKIDQQLFEPKIRLRKLSTELQLPACKVPLQLIDNRMEKVAGRMTIRVQCIQPKWQVFVPVNVDGKKPLVISAKAILNRAVITSEDVTQVYVSYKKIPNGSLVDINKAIGMKAKRPIGANQPIKARDLLPPYWVFKNKQVNIITRIGDIEVKTKGTALKSGVIDEQVPVENLKTKKVVMGIVIAPNTVIIP